MHHALDKRFIFLLIAEYVYMTTFKAETSISRPIPFPPDREIGMMIATFCFQYLTLHYSCSRIWTKRMC